jgi:hypothetical protein
MKEQLFGVIFPLSIGALPRRTILKYKTFNATIAFAW